MSDFERLVALVGLPTALCIVLIVLLIKGVLVPGKLYYAKCAECEAWRAWALSGTTLAEQAKAKLDEHRQRSTP